MQEKKGDEIEKKNEERKKKAIYILNCINKITVYRQRKKNE